MTLFFIDVIIVRLSAKDGGNHSEEWVKEKIYNCIAKKTKFFLEIGKTSTKGKIFHIKKK